MRDFAKAALGKIGETAVNLATVPIAVAILAIVLLPVTYFLRLAEESYLVWRDAVIACLLVWLVGDSTNLFAKVLRSVLVPIIIGLSAVGILQIAFSVADGNWRLLLTIEDAIYRFWGEYHDRAELPLSILFVAVPVLLTLSQAFPEARLVSRFFKAKILVSQSAAVIGCVASFTFFAETPITNQDARMRQYVAAERGDPTKRAEIDRLSPLVARAVVEEFRDLSPAAKSYYRHLLTALRTRTRPGERGDVVERAARSEAAFFAVDPPPLEEPAGPTGVGEQTWEGLSELFSETLGGLMPETEGVTADFLKTLSEECAKRMFDKGIRAPAEDRIDALLDWTRNRFREAVQARLSSLARGGGGDVKPDSDPAETEVRQAKIESKQALRREAPSTATGKGRDARDRFPPPAVRPAEPAPVEAAP